VRVFGQQLTPRRGEATVQAVGHVDPAAYAAGQQTARGQALHRFAQRAARYPEFFSQCAFGRQAGAGGIAAVEQAALEFAGGAVGGGGRHGGGCRRIGPTNFA
jgi:hypothetical protein